MNAVTTSVNAKRGKLPKKKRSFKDQFTSFLFAAPYLVVFALFIGFPIVFGFIVSLHNWNPIVGPLKFVGLQQYVQLFDFHTLAAQEFWNGLKNTCIFVVISVPFLVSVPTVVAYFIHNARFKDFFRSIYFFPTVMSATAVTTLWSWILATQGGAINGILGISIPWLVNQPWAWVSLTAATVWWTLGFNMLIIYAGLTQIPETTIEAAKMDGAGPFRIFFSLVVPQLRNVLTFVLIISVIQSFNVFAQPQLMTGGGPGSSTQVLTMNIYDQGFRAMHMGSADAMAYMMALILVIISIIQFRVTREKGDS